MFVVCSASLPPPKPKSSRISDIKRVKREMEAKRLETFKKIQQSAKDIAETEIAYVKSILPKELFDEEEDL